MTFISTDEVVIRYRSGQSIAGSVRDAEGVHDVTFTLDGWCCSSCDGVCTHILAIQGVASIC